MNGLAKSGRKGGWPVAPATGMEAQHAECSALLERIDKLVDQIKEPFLTEGDAGPDAPLFNVMEELERVVWANSKLYSQLCIVSFVKFVKSTDLKVVGDYI